jgi:transcriptional regulator with XRE-family HTH domain
MPPEIKSPASCKTAKELGQLIRRYRKSKNLTIATVSGLANVSPRFLSELERGKETAEIGKILKTLQTLGLDIAIRSRASAPVSASDTTKITNVDTGDDTGHD